MQELNFLIIDQNLLTNSYCSKVFIFVRFQKLQ